MKTSIVLLMIVLILYIAFVSVLFATGKRTAVRAISGFIPDCIVLFKNLIKDKTVATRYKFLLILLIGYLVSPIDLVPDFIPIAGQLDDAILVAVVLRFVLEGVGPALAAKHWPGPNSSLNMLLKLAGVRQKYLAP